MTSGPASYHLSARTTTYIGTYDIDAPKPFCGPAFVNLEGTLKLQLRVHTNPSGRYQRTYGVFGILRVTPLAPAGSPANAIVWEAHRAMLTDNYGEITEQASQTLTKAVAPSA